MTHNPVRAMLERLCATTCPCRCCADVRSDARRDLAALAQPEGGLAKGTRCWDVDLCCGDDPCRFHNGESLPRGVYCAKEAARPPATPAAPAPESGEVEAVARELWDLVEQHPGWKGAPIKPRPWDRCEPWFVPIQLDMARHVLGMVAAARAEAGEAVRGACERAAGVAYDEAAQVDATPRATAIVRAVWAGMGAR
jgi:hypothetical protein